MLGFSTHRPWAAPRRARASAPAWAAACLLAAAGPHPARALDTTYALEQYSAKHWGEDEGLPQNLVAAIVQTRDGYLWLGTEEGLVRFDGVRFTVYDTARVPELAASGVEALLEAPDGALWIGTLGGGLVRYAGGTFVRHAQQPHFEDATITSLAPDGGGGLWIGTDRGLYRLAGRRLTAHAPAGGRPGGDAVNDLLYDGHGRLWCATDAGLAVRAGERWRLLTTADGLPHDRVHVLAEDDEGLWVGTAQGLARLSDGAAGTFEVPEQNTPLAVRALLVDRHGGLWAGTKEGLLRVYAGRDGGMVVERGWPSAPVVSLLEDHEGSLWIGSEGGGLTRLRAGPAVTFGAPQGLGDLQVSAVTGDPHGDLWVGTMTGGVFHLRGGRFVEIPSRGVLRSERARTLLATRDGALWIGSDYGLFRWDGRRFTGYGPAQGLPPFGVRVLGEEADGTIWVGTDGGGLARLSGGRFEVLTERDGLASNQVRALLPARRGGLWIGTYGGLSHYHDGRFTNLTTAGGLPSRFVRALHEDADGTLWIGTFGGGLVRLRDGRVTSYRRRHGLASDVIYQILDDRRGHLWLSCNIGVFRIARRQLEAFADGRSAAIDSRLYGKGDGMGSRECNGGKPAGWRTADGRLWFPTVAGLVMFDPAREKRNEVPPAVVVTEVILEDRLLQPEDGMVVPPGARRIEIFFTALSFVAPRRNWLLYRLEGYDEDWREAGDDRDAVYTHLPPGAYRFHVIAANSDGVWNREGASFAFHVQPFFHETPYFYALAAVAVLLAAFAVYLLRTRQLRARERELRRRVEEALARLKVLSGLLPICASCKTIRDDGGYWQQLEGYIRDHSQAEFSHGICPDCARRLYPDFELPEAAERTG